MEPAVVLLLAPPMPIVRPVMYAVAAFVLFLAPPMPIAGPVIYALVAFVLLLARPMPIADLVMYAVVEVVYPSNSRAQLRLLIFIRMSTQVG